MTLCVPLQMESSVCQFDTDLLQLHLDSQLKQDDLQLLTLFQEMLLLKQFEKREGEELQERLNVCIQEEKNISAKNRFIHISKLEEYNELLELKRSNIAKLQEREKALTAAFKASLGENNPFQEFLTKVFRKKIKGVKKKEGNEGDGRKQNPWDSI
ncbi:hypothetical protein XENOCAPTIV_007055 [Xenoophorus captivus]|uniref:Uncharacterized protein n=1 Tax=Xenoophorus captivus TaxID=1517983 RepID=A0ABV0QGX1_9TELE